MSGFGLNDEVRHAKTIPEQSIANMLRGMSALDVSKIRDSVIAKEYARANRLVISWIAGSSKYGFRDLKTGKEVVSAWPGGFSSYRGLYNAMKQYVATGRVW